VKSKTTGLKFYITNDADAGRRLHDEIRRRIKAWVLRHGGDQTRSRQVYAATFEAVQNAICYGSELGDVVELTVNEEPDGLRIQVTQRKEWSSAEKEFARAREHLKCEDRRQRLGGLVTMSNLATKLNVSNGKRTIEMHFT
jgi:anti-sigma regulatory factor (Ser/Thr protein kinase)